MRGMSGEPRWRGLSTSPGTPVARRARRPLRTGRLRTPRREGEIVKGYVDGQAGSQDRSGRTP